MKRMITILLCLLLMIGLFGCDIRQTEPSGPLQELTDVTNALNGELSMSVHTKKGQIYGPYTVAQPQIPDKIMGRLIDAPSGLGRYDHWLVIKVDDAVITIYIGDRILICLDENDQQVYYQEEAGTLACCLRRCFDEAEFGNQIFRVMPLVAGGSGALREYASKAYPTLRMELAPGGTYSFRDYDLMDYQVESSDGSNMTGVFVYAALPDTEDSVLYSHGELLTEKPYEGYVLITERVVLEHREDGYWYAVADLEDN